MILCLVTFALYLNEGKIITIKEHSEHTIGSYGLGPNPNFRLVP